MVRQDNGMFVAEEIFITVRELSNSGFFTWSTWIRSHDAIYGRYWMNPKKDTRPLSTRTRHLHMSSGAMLRAQLKNGTIDKVGRGLYIFLENKPRGPLFDRSGRSSRVMKGN